VLKDAIEEEILESVPKTMKTKAELLVRKMKEDPSIAWSEKGELKYKGETFLLFLGVFGEYGLIGEGLCCRLRDLGALFV
jgi:hypothetical protein